MIKEKTDSKIYTYTVYSCLIRLIRTPIRARTCAGTRVHIICIKH